MGLEQHSSTILMLLQSEILILDENMIQLMTFLMYRKINPFDEEIALQRASIA